MKVMNVICLLIWIFNLVCGIANIVNNEPVSPTLYICAVVVCIIYYLGEVFLN